MIKPFSSNPKLEKWRPSNKTISNIEKARELWGLGDELNEFEINLINVAAYSKKNDTPEKIFAAAELMMEQMDRYRRRRN